MPSKQPFKRYRFPAAVILSSDGCKNLVMSYPGELKST